MPDAAIFSIREIGFYERPVTLRLPFRFGVVTLTQCPQAFARVRIETPDGRSQWGMAAELMVPKWFDKNAALSNADNFNQLRQVLLLAGDSYLSDAHAATAFGHFARHHDPYMKAATARGFNPLLASYGPAMLDRAVMDAHCRLAGIPFYQAVTANSLGIGIDRSEFSTLDMSPYLAQLKPAQSMEARHTVGLLDAITATDLAERVSDGLPETLEEVTQVYGHRYFKLKVSGQVDPDLDRLEAIANVLDRSDKPYFASLDGNEQYNDAAGLMALVDGIRGRKALGRLWKSILFIEQPIARKVALDVDLRQVKLDKPVIIDESDGELDTFLWARERGYTGVSSKTCKGIYKSILNSARCTSWNAQAGAMRYFMSAEDLTTQAGLAVQQDLALVNLLGISHVERNGHHYVNGMAALTVEEQDAFLLAHPDLYERTQGAVRLRIRQGRIQMSSLACHGFASAVFPDLRTMNPMAEVLEASADLNSF